MLLGVGQEQRELLAADPRDRVDAAAGRRRDFSEAPQREVAGRVAEAVVQVLEVVEVADEDRERARAAQSALCLDLHQLLEAAPVQEAGERVCARGVREPRDQAVHALAEHGEHQRDHHHNSEQEQPALCAV